MLSSRHQLPPQTSRKARRAYLKSNKHFEFTPTQKRASERRQQLDKRAKALQAKEQQKKDNRRKRQEKEAAEREAKRRRIESGKAPIETLWGKVRASQPRLNAFFVQPQAADKDLDNRLETEDESILDHGLQRGVRDRTIEQATEDSVVDTEGLETLLSPAPSIPSTDMGQALYIRPAEGSAQLKAGVLVKDTPDITNAAPSNSGDPDQALLDAQLSLSQGIFDFDIAEDDDAEWLPQRVENAVHPDAVHLSKPHSDMLGTPSKRKAEAGDNDFASTAKSARSVLSEMSPSKVNIRAQEKPDTSSVASIDSKLHTPSPPKKTGSQSAAEVLAMIATQDLEDDEFATDKENQDPWRSESNRELRKKDADHKTAGLPSVNVEHDTYGNLLATEKPSNQHYSFDEDIFDDDDDDDDIGAFESGLEDEQDDFNRDVDDEVLAILATHTPSKQRSFLFAGRMSTSVSSIAKPLTFEDAPSTLRSSKSVEDITIGGDMALPSPQMFSTKTPAQAHTPLPQNGIPTATQGNSFAFDDVQDDDLTSFAEAFDVNNSSPGRQVSKDSKKSRIIPWNHPSQFPIPESSDEPLSQDEDPFD